jgi:hypothetical protein
MATPTPMLTETDVRRIVQEMLDAAEAKSNAIAAAAMAQAERMSMWASGRLKPDTPDGGISDA